MAKWLVTTQATVERVYQVEAENAKEAEVASISSECLVCETDLNEETLSIVERRLTMTLLTRLSEAEGPDREIDALIAIEIGWATERHGLPRGGWVSKGPDQAVIPAPRYTGSVDGALTLVPDEWEWQISNRAPKPHAGRAFIHNRELQFIGGGMARNPRFMGYEATAATPILALCIVSLKAHDAIQHPASSVTAQQPAGAEGYREQGGG